MFEGDLQISMLFMSFPPSWDILGKAWEADVEAISIIPALFGHLGKGLESRFRRYLRHSRPLWVSLGKAGRADLDAIYVIPSLFGHLCVRLGEQV